MNLHALPRLKDELEALQNTQVELRVTLSYFIEPNPSTRGLPSKFYSPRIAYGSMSSVHWMDPLTFSWRGSMQPLSAKMKGIG